MNIGPFVVVVVEEEIGKEIEVFTFTDGVTVRVIIVVSVSSCRQTRQHLWSTLNFPTECPKHLGEESVYLS